MSQREDGPARVHPQAAGRPPARNWLLVPLAIFAVVSAMFAYALTFSDPSKLPSTFIGRPVPKTEFAPLEGLVDGDRSVPGFTSVDLAKGKVSVVNFWASWCVPCTEEHPLLGELRQRAGVDVFGVNYKDQTAAARRFLGRYGNPFAAVGVDGSGRGAIEWGVYGMPETFVVNGRGEVVYKHVGPITAESLAATVLPAIEKAKSATTAGQ